MSSYPNRRTHGRLHRMTRADRAKRLARRKQRGSWAARVWIKQHVKGTR